MYHRLTLVTVIIALAGSTLSAVETTVESEVKSVIVYPGQAQVTRLVKLDLEAGAHSIIVENLPGGAVDRSIRASASGLPGITLLGLSHTRIDHREAPNPKVAELEKEIERLNLEDKRAVTDRLGTFEQLKKFVASLSEGATKEMTREVAEGGLDVSQWNAAYSFVGDKNRSLNDSIRVARRELKEVNDRLEDLGNELRKTATTHRRVTKTVQVDLELERGGEVDLNLEYITSGAQWKPLYDARIGDNPDSVRLTYFAEVTQKTGEDWSDIDLTLSTAQPSMGAGPTAFRAWSLDVLRYGRPQTSVGSTGQIKGRVTSAETGEPIIGASVLVVGTTMGAMTDIKGEFQILRLTPGYYTLRISHLEYATNEITQVGVTSEGTTRVGRRLVPKVTDLDRTITVVGKVDVLDKFQVDSQVSVDNLLENVTGVQVSNSAGRRVRGGRSGEASIIAPSMMVNALRESSDMALVTGSIVTGATYPTVFKIKRKETIPSGDKAVRVTVADWRFEGDTRLLSRPRTRSGAYRLVKLSNQEDAPLMPGQVSIFAGTHFIGHWQLVQLIPPGEDFELPFGLDNRVSVEREILDFKRERKGSKTRIEQTVQITIQNHSDEFQTVNLEEPIPISRDNQIKIKVHKIEPEPDERSKRGKLSWKLEVAPGEKTVVTIPYRITVPAGKQIFGL